MHQRKVTLKLKHGMCRVDMCVMVIVTDLLSGSTMHSD